MAFVQLPGVKVSNILFFYSKFSILMARIGDMQLGFQVRKFNYPLCCKYTNQNEYVDNQNRSHKESYNY